MSKPIFFYVLWLILALSPPPLQAEEKDTPVTLVFSKEIPNAWTSTLVGKSYMFNS